MSSTDPKKYAYGIVVAIIVLMIGITMGDTVVTTVQDVNTTAWTFTGHEAAEDLLDLIPLLYWAGIAIGAGLSFFMISRMANISNFNPKSRFVNELAISRMRGVS